MSEIHCELIDLLHFQLSQKECSQNIWSFHFYRIVLFIVIYRIACKPANSVYFCILFVLL